MNWDVPTEPEAPGRLSTMIDSPSRSESFCAMSLAVVSVGPPTGNATTMRNAWLGQLFAKEGKGIIAAPMAVRAEALIKVRRLKREGCDIFSLLGLSVFSCGKVR